MSDTPSTNRPQGEGTGVDIVGQRGGRKQTQDQEDQGQVQGQGEKGMMQSAQEMVAKALGGGSRGMSCP